MSAQPLRKLRQKWLLTAAFGVALYGGFYAWLQTWWASPYPQRWLLLAALAQAYLLAVLWRGLPNNHRPQENNLLHTLGWGNLLSIARGLILVLFCGFLFSPWPEVRWTPWLPGLLYTLAALPDFVDGIAARLTNHVTQLGVILDMSLDSLGVLAVSLLSVQYGQVPWWYLSVGLARYIFLVGIWLRQKLGLPILALPFSVRRRGYAALAMGLFFVILYPVFRPPATHLAAAIFAFYILGGFLWDWLVTIGWLPPQPGENYRRLENFVVQMIPLFLRSLLLLWGFLILGPALYASGGSPLLWAQVAAALALILGVGARMMSIAALVFLGLQQNVTPLDGFQMGLVVLYANLLFLGTGAFSLWPFENRLIFRRVGDPQ